jgi:DNA-binding GntR family transcriptional regulator
MSKTGDPYEMFSAEGSRSLTKTAAAFQALRSAIETGRLRPGERLRISSLIELLGMSPTPIREALRLLQAEGLVAHEPHRGMVVRLYVLEEVDELYRLRLLLEPAATERAAEHAAPAEMKQIQALHRKLKSAVSSPSATDSAQLNAAWHRAIYSACGSPYLIQFIMRLWSAMPVEAVWLSSHALDSIDEHQAVMDAIGNRDAKAAAEAMKRHIEQGQQMHAKRLREFGRPSGQELLA